MGLLSSIFGGGDDVTQETDIDIVNQNEFSPNVIITGLDTIGAFLRDGLNAVAGADRAAVASQDQAGLNISSAIDGAGVNLTNGILGASENVGDSLESVGTNLAFAVIVGAGTLTLGKVLLRG